MRFKLTILCLSILITGLSGTYGFADEKAGHGEWVKYFTWKGEVDEILVLRIHDETVKAVYPVGSGFKNSTHTFFSGAPESECVAKVEVIEGRGKVAVSKQWWQKPDNALKVQIMDTEPGYGKYEFSVYYKVGTFSSNDKMVYQKEVNRALYDFDVFHMDKAIAKDDLVDALRWARSAYETDRLNWDMLNIIGDLHFKNNQKDLAEDIYIILRDYGYLTDENLERFKELNPFEAAKMEKAEDEEDLDNEDEGSGEDDEMNGDDDENP